MVKALLLTTACVLVAVGLVAATSAPAPAGQAGFPTAADIGSYRKTVEQVFMTDRGGTVAVKAQAAGGAIEIEVCDTGVGIPAGDIDRVFERRLAAAGSTAPGRW